MLGALRLMTVERGIDPRGFVLMPFGGAGPLHAAAMAQELGIERILCPRASGVLSALGLAAAAPRRDVSRTVMLGADSLAGERLGQERETLISEACSALGGSAERLRVRHELRYRGQSFELPVEEEIDPGRGEDGLDPAALRAMFASAHEARYGYRDDSAEVELVNIRVSAFGPAPSLRPRAAPEAEQVAGTHPIVFAGRRIPAAILRGELAPATPLSGPAICALPESTLLVPPGWSGTVDAHGTVHLQRQATSPTGASHALASAG
jgi:N-methylhydantoinase A